MLTREEVDEILADDDRDVHNIAPAVWSSAELILPYGELGYGQWQLAEQVRENELQTLSLTAVKQAAAELSEELPEVVVLAFDYEAEDEELAAALDRVLAPEGPLRALL